MTIQDGPKLVTLTAAISYWRGERMDVLSLCDKHPCDKHPGFIALLQTRKDLHKNHPSRVETVYFKVGRCW